MRAKTVLSAIAMFVPMMAMATRILWIGVDENSIVDLGVNRITITDWFKTLPCDPVDIGGTISVGGTPMPAGYEDPPHQQPPSVSFDDELVEFGLVVVDEYDEPTGQLADWQPIRLDVVDRNAVVRFDIGYWDADADWAFVSIASASAVLGDLLEPHTYEAGTLLPPTETPWRPTLFYGAIPEPVTANLARLGAIVLWLSSRRRR